MSYQRTSLVLIATIFLSLLTSSASAVMLGQYDTFQDGSTNNWAVGFSPTNAPFVSNAADSGPGGLGDHVLDVVRQSRLAVYNESQWSGDWTGAGITQVTMYARSLDSTDLTIWLGFSQNAPGPGGSGDTYVSSQGQAVPGDGAWHAISFPVAIADWEGFDGNNVAAALQNVTQFRVISSATKSFLGDTLGEGFQIDNIRAVPEPSTLCLALLAAGAIIWSPKRRE